LGVASVMVVVVVAATVSLALYHQGVQPLLATLVCLQPNLALAARAVQRFNGASSLTMMMTMKMVTMVRMVMTATTTLVTQGCTPRAGGVVERVFMADDGTSRWHALLDRVPSLLIVLPPPPALLLVVQVVVRLLLLLPLHPGLGMLLLVVVTVAPRLETLQRLAPLSTAVKALRLRRGVSDRRVWPRSPRLRACRRRLRCLELRQFQLITVQLEQVSKLRASAVEQADRRVPSDRCRRMEAAVGPRRKPSPSCLSRSERSRSPPTRRSRRTTPRLPARTVSVCVVPVGGGALLVCVLPPVPSPWSAVMRVAL
jgi:hypothetical protein